MQSFSCCVVQGVNEAYAELNNSVNDLESVVANWESQPVTDIVRVQGTASCATGYSELTGLTWPGASSLGWYVTTNCACSKWCTYFAILYAAHARALGKQDLRLNLRLAALAHAMVTRQVSAVPQTQVWAV